MPGNLVIPLNLYVQRFLTQQGVEMRSVTLTPDWVSISIRKQVEPRGCTGATGIDSNLDNITSIDTQNQVDRYDISKATRVRAICRRTRRRFNRNDVRIRKQLFAKYGRIERNRAGWLTHNVSSNIVLQAKLKKQMIVMEDLNGIRKLYHRGNGQTSGYRSKMNSWSFAELQRQIRYKSDWNEIHVIYVRPGGTSAKCSMCGHQVLPEENRQLHCPNCGLTMDRDVNAARNILARGLRFKPVGSANEAMVAELAQQQAVICKVDADQLDLRFTKGADKLTEPLY